MTPNQLKAQLQNGPDDELLLSAPEICVWMTVFGCIKTIGEMHHNFKEKTITEKQYYQDTNAALVGLASSADATHRFGVLLPSTIEPNYKRVLRTHEKHVQVTFSPGFWRWFNWWDDYVRTFTPDVAKHVYRLSMDRLPAVEKYRPTGDWTSYTDVPKLVVS